MTGTFGNPSPVVLISQPADSAGSSFSAVRVDGVPLAGDASIVISPADSDRARADAAQLQTVLLNELKALAPGVAAASPASSADLGGSLSPPPRVQLLVLVGDERTPVAPLPFEAPWAAGDPAHPVLPVLPLAARPNSAALLRPPYATMNARFWSDSLDEVVSAIFALAGITSEYAGLFISYRQTDAAALGEQLFDALNRRGFDVFLDRFSVPSGVNFQPRLRQELGDKSMVLFIESPEFLDSTWVREEVSVAQSCQLGVLALHLPGGVQIKTVGTDLRIAIDAADLAGAGRDATLTPAALTAVVDAIVRAHDRAFARRRRRLRKSLVQTLAVVDADFSLHQSGAFVVRSAPPRTKQYLVWLTDRPPELADFRLAHGGRSLPSDTAVVVGLSRLMEAPRLAQFQWLSDVSTVKSVDEGALLDLAEQMRAGDL